MKPFVVLSCVSGKIPTVSPVKFVWQIRITIPRATARAENLFGICQSNLEWRSRPLTKVVLRMPNNISPRMIPYHFPLMRSSYYTLTKF
jgi:hypothetical protein